MPCEAVLEPNPDVLYETFGEIDVESARGPQETDLGLLDAGVVSGSSPEEAIAPMKAPNVRN